MMHERSAAELLALDNAIQRWASENLKHVRCSAGTSPDLLFAHLGTTNAKSMFSSLVLALCLIALLIGGLMRSWAATAIGLICNLLPIVIIYGVWSLGNGYLTLGSAVVMGMIVGIIVDDTIHLLFKYKVYASKSTREEAVRDLWQFVMPAIWISSLTLGVALTVGLFSDFRPIREISTFSIAILATALLLDGFLLPQLLKYSGHSDKGVTY
jgi:predicted RND superfamily exporter protein